MHAKAKRTNAETMRRLCENPPARPRELDRNIPRDLDELVWSLIEKHPGRRIQTADELLQKLLSAEAPTLRGQLAQRFAQRRVVRRLGRVVEAAARKLQPPTRPTSAHGVLLPQLSDRRALGGGRQYFPCATSLRI